MSVKSFAWSTSKQHQEKLAARHRIELLIDLHYRNNRTQNASKLKRIQTIRHINFSRPLKMQIAIISHAQIIDAHSLCDL